MNRLLLGCCLLALSAPPSVALGQPAPTTQEAAYNGQIHVTGDATVYCVPDEVIIRLGVVTAAKDLDTARRDNETAAERLVGSIKNLGVEERAIQTDAVQVAIEYTDNRPTKGIDGYVVTRQYAVTLKSPERLGELLDAALTSGANVIEGIEYQTSKLREYRDKARLMAAQAAKEKADALAGAYGVSVGLPLQITEGNMAYYGGSYGSFGRGQMTQNSFQYVGGEAMSAGESIPLGQVAIRASVSVQFDLER